MPSIHKIVPCLWFDHQAEEAANLYCATFEGSRITAISRFPDAGKEIHGRAAGSVMTVAFEIFGIPFTALNGGPIFQFNEAISLQVMCDSQDEIDRYWDALSAGGDPNARNCGWLKDKFGLSWQIVPKEMSSWMAGDPKAAARVMNAFMKMKKLDVAELKKAYAG